MSFGICRAGNQKNFWPAGYEFKSIANGDTFGGFDGVRIPLSCLTNADYSSAGHTCYLQTSLGDTILVANVRWWNTMISLFDFYKYDYEKLKAIRWIYDPSHTFFEASVYSWLEKN